MATLAGNVLTLADWAKRKDPTGRISAIVEMLAQTNEVLDDALFKEGNLETGEQTTIRTGLPAVYWRLINQGVPPSKSTTAQVTENCGMLEAWSEVDEALAELNGNTAEFRASEAAPFTEAMNQEATQTLFYGNAGTAPEEFNGFAVRYSSLSAGNGGNIIDGGGTGSDNSSIYVIGWGANTVHGIFPKGTSAGVSHTDFGKQVVETTAGIAGNRMVAYREQWKWRMGLAVKDWRYAVRVANIDISNLVANGGSQAAVVNLLIKALHRIPMMNMAKVVIYMNRTVFEMFDIQRLNAVSAGGGLTYENVDGKRIASFRGVPIKIVDQLLETEARVV